MKKIFLFAILFYGLIHAQTIYELPFASKGNQIELSVANTTDITLENITVNIDATPGWINFEKCQAIIAKIAGNNESPALFEFSVDKKSPVGEEGKIIFKIKNLHGDEWSKEINVIVSKPVNYELTQNYPNPFNPSTKIEFIIPNDEKVTVKVYDILGREVETLLNDFREAGHHEVEFNASRFASGMYIYRLTSGNFSQIKKMMLIK